MEDVDQRITCSICLSNFRKPKIIDCLHTYCETCLGDYINKFAADNKFDCPLCRRTITVPPNGANDFPVNFYVEEQEMGNAKEEFCSDHEKEILDGYCSYCQLVVCRQCKQTDHRNHDVQSLQDIRQTFVLELQTLKRELADNISKFQHDSEEFRTRISKKKKSADQLCSEVDLQVDTICQTTRKQGEDIKDIVKKGLAEELMHLDALHVEAKRNLFSVKSLYTMTSQILKEASTVELINNMDLIRLEKEEVCPHDVKTPEVPSIPVMEFDPGDISAEDLSLLIGVLTVTFQHRFNIHQIKVHADSPGYNSDILSWSVGVDARSERLNINLDMVSEVRKFCNCDFTLKLINKDDDERSLIQYGGKTFVQTTNYGRSFEWSSVIGMNELSNPDNGFIDAEDNFIIQADLDISDIVL